MPLFYSHLWGEFIKELANDLRLRALQWFDGLLPEKSVVPTAHQRGSERESMNHYESMYN